MSAPAETEPLRRAKSDPLGVGGVVRVAPRLVVISGEEAAEGWWGRSIRLSCGASGGRSIKELARTTGLSRNTIRSALRSETPPGYRRVPKTSVLEPFEGGDPSVAEDPSGLPKADPKLPVMRVGELLEPLGCRTCQTVVDDYLREVRPLFAPPPRPFQRTVWARCSASRSTARPEPEHDPRTDWADTYDDITTSPQRAKRPPDMM